MGEKVVVLDSSNKVGKKILMSGAGRCNVTNVTGHLGNITFCGPDRPSM